MQNDLAGDLTTMVRRKWSRCKAEPLFCDTKQYMSLGQCQSLVDKVMVRHMTLVLLSFSVSQVLREQLNKLLAAVKKRWQLAVLQNWEHARAVAGLPSQIARHRVSSISI